MAAGTRTGSGHRAPRNRKDEPSARRDRDDDARQDARIEGQGERPERSPACDSTAAPPAPASPAPARGPRLTVELYEGAAERSGGASDRDGPCWRLALDDFWLNLGGDAAWFCCLRAIREVPGVAACSLNPRLLWITPRSSPRDREDGADPKSDPIDWTAVAAALGANLPGLTGCRIVRKGPAAPPFTAAGTTSQQGD